jgi:hypothetical protein
MSDSAITVFFLIAFVGLLYAIVRYPLASLAFVLAMCAIAVAGKARADTLEVAAIIESEADRATMLDAVRDAQAITKDALGLDIAVKLVDISTVAGHTQAQALLDAVKQYRFDHTAHGAADATVLFTRRDVKGYAGIATVGPACSAQASAVVAIRNDGNDGAILAHELMHTVGVPHDKANGYLMSEELSRYTSRTMSPDSVLTFRAAGVGECMAPAAVIPPSTAKPAAPSTGGGGAFDTWVIILLTGLACWRVGVFQGKEHFRKWYDTTAKFAGEQDAVIQQQQDTIKAHEETIQRLLGELSAQAVAVSDEELLAIAKGYVQAINYADGPNTSNRTPKDTLWTFRQPWLLNTMRAARDL